MFYLFLEKIRQEELFELPSRRGSPALENLYLKYLHKLNYLMWNRQLTVEITWSVYSTKLSKIMACTVKQAAQLRHGDPASLAILRECVTLRLNFRLKGYVLHQWPLDRVMVVKQQHIATQHYIRPTYLLAAYTHHINMGHTHNQYINNRAAVRVKILIAINRAIKIFNLD